MQKTLNFVAAFIEWSLLVVFFLVFLLSANRRQCSLDATKYWLLQPSCFSHLIHRLPQLGPLKQPLCLRDDILKPKMCLGSQKFSHKDWKPRLKIDYFLFAWKCDGRWSSNFYRFIIFKTITATNKKKTKVKLLQKFCSINAAKWCFQSRARGVTLIMFKILQLMLWNVVGKSVSFHVLNKFMDCVPYPSR